MKKKDPDWLLPALQSLDFFERNPEYYKEFKHEYFVEQLGVTRQTLNRNPVYMARYKEVKEALRSSANPVAHRTTGLEAQKEINGSLREKLKQKDEEIAALKLRLNECYQMLEDHGIDPEFIYPKRRKKFAQV